MERDGQPHPGIAVEKIRDNPFYVLGLRPDATRAEIEREGQKLLGMLELKLQSAARYATPVGPAERTADKVRRAMAELRDPERRLEHEVWARLDPAAAPPAVVEASAPAARDAAPTRRGRTRSRCWAGGRRDEPDAPRPLRGAVRRGLSQGRRRRGAARAPLTRWPVPELTNPIGRFGVHAVFVWTLVAAGGAVIALVPLAAPLVLVFLVLLGFPWPITRLVLIPAGLPRLAYWLARTSDLTFRLDKHGGAAAAAAWALCRQRPFDEESAEWLAGKLAEQAPLRGAGVLASGLLLAARGDLAGARTIIGAVHDVDDRVCPPEAKRMAAGWLAADAAERGEWTRVAELGPTLAQAGRLAWLLSAIAQSLLLEPMAPGRLGLWLRWALAPHRRATLPLVQRALEALDGTFIEPEEEPPIAPAAPPGGDAIRTALSLHASVLTRAPGALRPEDVRAAGQAWDAALFDRATERLLLERALVVGATGAASVLGRMRAAVEDDLTAVVLATGMPLVDLGESGEVASRVRARLRDRLLTEVEAASDAIKRRVDDKRPLPGADEWREWSNLRACYERGVRRGGDELRRLAFVKVYPDACSYAVWLFNDQKQRPLGNAVFRWLLAEATALDDTRAMALMAKNVACGI